MSNKLDDARVKLMALAGNPVSKRQTLEAQILALKPAISEARKTGHTYAEIVGELRKAGINIEANTLKTYWSKIMRAEAVPEPQPATVEPVAAQDQEPEPVQVEPENEPEKCDFCFGEMAETSGVEGWKTCKSCGSKAHKTGSDVERKPACPTCKGPMQKRTGPKGAFWGCSSFPKCQGTRPDLD